MATWKKQYYQKNGKQTDFFKWVKVKPILDIAEYDETTLNKPKALTADIQFRNGNWELVNHETRQYSKGKAKTCLAFNGKNGKAFQIVNKQIAEITLKEKAIFLNRVCELGLLSKTDKLKVDSRNMGLVKYGFEVVLGKKKHVEIERLFGYKAKTIHKLKRNTDYNLVMAIHTKYLKKIFVNEIS